MAEKTGLLEKLKKLFSSPSKSEKSLPAHEDNPPCCRERDTLFDPTSSGVSTGYSSPCSER